MTIVESREVTLVDDLRHFDDASKQHRDDCMRLCDASAVLATQHPHSTRLQPSLPTYRRLTRGLNVGSRRMRDSVTFDRNVVIVILVGLVIML